MQPTILNEKRKAFTDGNRDDVRVIQRCFKTKIRRAKEDYKRKLERKLQQKTPARSEDDLLYCYRHQHTQKL